jgi:Ca2+-binding EF-hand superfamily protein
LRNIKPKTNSSMKKLTTILAALALGTSFSFAADEKPAAAAGDKPKRNPEEMFKKLDKDSDGKVTLEEFKESPMAKRDGAKPEEMFSKRDKNGDKSLSLEEFSAPREKK